ncbi:MAG: hypothetical protein IAF00_06740 [Phycisphaerales bacterium]|nr:hypothetical protein [Phycisphaerales bacterium]
MTETGSESCRWRPYGMWLLAAVSGALLSALILFLFYQLGGLLAVAPPLKLIGPDLGLAAGQGSLSPAGFEIRQSGPQGVAAVQTPIQSMVRASLYNRLSWRVRGLEPGHSLRLGWVTLSEPQTSQELVLPPVGPDEVGVLDLRDQPHWRGRIAALGLIVSGPLPQPLVLDQFELRPMPLSASDLFALALKEWKVFEGWSQRSINYTSGAPLDALFPPVLVVALWVAMSAVLYALFDPPRRRQWMPYAALFCLGWLVLDLRWQEDLQQRLVQSREHFADKSQEERRLAALDGDLYRFLREVRQHLPEQPVRLFIVSADPYGFQAGRARYHLLPHNAYTGFSRIPRVNEAHAGDYLLILSPLKGVGYNRGTQALEWQGGRLQADLLYGTASGALFRVRGG